MNRRGIGLFIFLIGLLVLLVPQWKIFYNDYNHRAQISSYQDRVEKNEYKQTQEAVKSYNERIQEDQVADPFNVYNGLVSGNQAQIFSQGEIIGYVEIPKIGEKLPIYVGASNYHLSIGVAVVENTSMPTGGRGTRSVIAGHRGYGYGNMFRNLDDLEVGDEFYVYIFGNILSYTIYEKEVIMPTQTEKVAIIPGEDIITLLTCHPLYSNEKRLLVHGKRTEVSKELEEANQQQTLENEEVITPTKKNQIQYSAFVKYHLQNRLLVFGGTSLLILNLIALIKVCYPKKKK